MDSTNGKKVTLDEMVAKAKNDHHTHDYVRANYAQVVTEVEAELGPQVPAMTLRRGRPRKGELPETVQVKSIKMTPDFWKAFQAQADAAGMNLHAAMRAALVEWTSRHRAS
jgi:hypothetical protein